MLQELRVSLERIKLRVPLGNIGDVLPVGLLVLLPLEVITLIKKTIVRQRLHRTYVYFAVAEIIR